MEKSNLSSILNGLGGLGFFLLWVVMILDGTFAAVWNAATTGEFADGRPLQTRYTWIFPIDFAISILMAFFDPLTNLVHMAPYMIFFELIGSIHVFYILAMVESRRAAKDSWLRVPALWQTIYNCIGVAVGLPFFTRCYVEQDSSINTGRLPEADAQALPFTTVWSWLLLPLMMLPAWTSLETTHAQIIVATWFLTPLFIPGFQRLASDAAARMSYKGIAKPVTVTYILSGVISAALRVGLVISIIASADPDVSFRRVYIPNFAAVQPRRADTIVEGAHLFIQLDYMLTIILVLIHGIYMSGEPIIGHANRTKKSPWALTLVTLVFGPGAGMSYAAYLKESRVESVGARSKQH
ncbi:hypothetical protein B0I35DRAFT_215602 [Stachybotrys elegans]|uniref:Uncharacterized protein n=1 Tax=Stachybotrys elegans TaxID=80388 RepID=A0A8K0WRJ5_9HYPO|nr:hypothetical protein B0I35DRAFT_215602 [Stachybotrys elegans]